MLSIFHKSPLDVGKNKISDSERALYKQIIGNLELQIENYKKKEELYKSMVTQLKNYIEKRLGI